MEGFNWKSVDLNLLVAFQALYQTHSVSEAAIKCHVSQSAMSHSLQRLRTMLGDPLFQRVSSSMQPTQRAHSVSPHIDQILSVVQNELVADKPFSAEKYDGVWKIGLTDYAEQLFAPLIYDHLSLISVNAQVSFTHVDRANYRQIAELAQLDVLIGSISGLDSHFVSEHLYQEQHVCLYDPSKLSFSTPMTIEEFTQVDHALVSPDGSLATAVDAKLKKMAKSRRVAVSSRNFLTVQQLILGRELICIVPKRSVYSQQLCAVKPPVDVANFDIDLIYAKSQKYAAKNRWLREQVIDVIRGIANH